MEALLSPSAFQPQDIQAALKGREGRDPDAEEASPRTSLLQLHLGTDSKDEEQPWRPDVHRR